MGNRREFAARVVCGLLLAVCALTLAAASASAQQGVTPGGPPPEGLRDPFAEIRERQQREAQLRSAEMLGLAKTTDRRDAEGVVEQLKNDFKSIQILRNKLVRHLKSDKALDYKFIADEAEEIGRRALRLRMNLAPETPAGEKRELEKQVEIADAQMTDALATMCKRIDSFTENPVFKAPNVVDVHQSAKANRDLRHIILLSGGIRRAAERKAKEQK